MSYEMSSQLKICFEQLAAFWTFKVSDLAVNNQMLFEILFRFECFITLRTPEVSRCLVDV
jgi:hypothetical protein